MISSQSQMLVCGAKVDDLTLLKKNAAIYAPLYSPSLGEETQIIHKDGWYQTFTPTLNEPSLNEVVVSHLEDSEVEKCIDETFAMYLKQNLSFRWYIGPMSSPARIEKIISSKAQSFSEFRGMVSNTDQLIQIPANITVEPVDTKNFDEFMKTNLIAWEANPSQVEFHTIKMKRYLLHPRCRLFLAKKDDEPIGTAATVMKDGYGYLIGGAILEPYRGHGAYRSLIQARLMALKEENLPFAVTWARETTSAPILENLGFKSAFIAKNYSLGI